MKFSLIFSAVITTMGLAAYAFGQWSQTANPHLKIAARTLLGLELIAIVIWWLLNWNGGDL